MPFLNNKCCSELWIHWIHSLLLREIILPGLAALPVDIYLSISSWTIPFSFLPGLTTLSFEKKRIHQFVVNALIKKQLLHLIVILFALSRLLNYSISLSSWIVNMACLENKKGIHSKWMPSFFLSISLFCTACWENRYTFILLSFHSRIQHQKGC